MVREMILAGLMAAGCCKAGISDMTAEFRNGQVFIQWKENKLPAGARLAVYSSTSPITAENFKKCTLLADMINPASSTDWWLDINNFVIKRTKAMIADEPFAGNVGSAGKKGVSERGFVISDLGKPVAPGNGLHVHTPGKDQTGMRYYAAAAVNKGEVCGFTALAKPVMVKEGKSYPITISGKKLGKDSCRGLPLFVMLHGRGGGAGVDNKGNALGTHIIYVPRTLAWREGIPFKFRVIKGKNDVTIIPSDRIWIGRKMSTAEISDGRDKVKAVSTFWMGYNTNIARSIKGPEFVCDNYTERLLLYMVRWAQEYLGTDPAATYITGGSMGGTGAVQMATHYPEVFAAVAALVPVYSYTWLTNPRSKSGAVQATSGNSMTRIRCSAGKFTKKNPAVMPDGRKLEDYLNGAANINRPAVDITPILATNGRQDSSIPWVNNPPFYRAANEARQAFSVYWNNGKHGMSSSAPKDMKNAYSRAGLLRYRLDKSYPAFSNCSSNRNYGNGDPSDGDPAGWINRGFSWKIIADTAQKYEIEIRAAYPGLTYPVTSDVTFRRRQMFKFPAGTVLKAAVNGKQTTVAIDKHGLLTIEKVTFNNSDPVRITITR